jgi:hypothetical protein
MADDHSHPKAVVFLVVGHREVPLGVIDAATRCDLTLIDDLGRLQLLGPRLGGSIRLARVDGELRDLVEFVGLGDCLGLDPSPRDPSSRTYPLTR